MSNIINETEREYLLNSMEELLEEYDYTYSTTALNIIIDEWANQKQLLIEAFKKHPNYIDGKFMIAFTCDYERAINSQGTSGFSRFLIYYPIEEMVDTLPEKINEQRIKEHCAYLPNDLYNLFWHLSSYMCQILDEELAMRINDMLPNIKARAGQKFSRVINKICTYLGYDKHPEYNKEFAKFADSLSPLVIKRHSIISLNPLDYLTMSFGNSWASCHTIDKRNKRGMPNHYSGQYSSGTMSYMLDPSSFVFYTVESTYEGTDYWAQPKIHRQMFHWGEEKLVQGRLYPQDNDGYSDNYTPYRNIVQKIFSECFGFDNLWSISKGRDAASRYILSEGTHYRDYESYSNCTLSRIKESTNESCFVVGAIPICIECGYRHETEECINCCRDNSIVCRDCGCDLDEDDIIWIDDEPYCRDCVNYCECCDSYHRGRTYYISSERISVCEFCYDDYYVVCEDCDLTLHRDAAIYDEELGVWFCEDCCAERDEKEGEEE